jgi:hypothetical protein
VEAGPPGRLGSVATPAEQGAAFELPSPAEPPAKEGRMRLFKCDHCGKTESPKQEADYIENWETITISTNFHYDICEECSPALFKFFDKKAV